MFCNVAVSKLGIKLGFRLGSHPYALCLEVTFQGQNSVCMVNQCISPVKQV